MRLPVNAELSASEKKLGELILYVSKRCLTDPKFGAVKLNKILYFSDFLAYGNLGKAITGVEYHHLPQGPGPRRLKPIRRYLEEKGYLAVERRPLKSGKEQHRTIALREPDLKEFSGQEIALVESVIADFRDLNAEDSSDLSHKMVGWKITDNEEIIPYGTIFLSDEPLNSAEIRRALELVSIGRERGLPVG